MQASPEDEKPTPEIERRQWLRQATALIAGTTAASLQAQDAATDADARLFPGFKTAKVETSGATIHVVSGGQGPPLLLLHGAPQSHATWHIIAPKLAREHTVIAADLRGYGDSSKPEGGTNHVNYSKRAMALDGVEVMKHFGFEKFVLVGHDRGGRVGHRMALDHPDRVTKLAVFDIVPTHKLFHNVTKEFATAYYHWFFLIQPAPFPETLINNSIDFYMRGGSPETRPEYLRVFKNPATVHAMCEDYRAAATIDLEHDDADMQHKVECPLLTLWAANGAMGRMFDVMAVWRERASKVSGKGLPGGHSLQETAPAETLAELEAFLKA
jgi:haloacetate dehalogenase